MNERIVVPWHLWVIGVVSLIWNAFGAYDYTMTQTRNEAYMGQFTPEQLEYFYGIPAWMDFFWALGVWGALLGSVLLLIRSRFAFHAFAVSLVGLIGSTFYTLTSDTPDGVVSGIGLFLTGIIWLSVILLAYYARRMSARGMLR